MNESCYNCCHSKNSLMSVYLVFHTINMHSSCDSMLESLAGSFTRVLPSFVFRIHGAAARETLRRNFDYSCSGELQKLREQLK